MRRMKTAKLHSKRGLLKRRGLMKKSVALVAGLALFPVAARAGNGRNALVSRSQRGQRQHSAPGKQGWSTVHTACLGCNARCGMRAVVDNGRLGEVSGNPFHPYNHGLLPAS